MIVTLYLFFKYCSNNIHDEGKWIWWAKWGTTEVWRREGNNVSVNLVEGLDDGMIWTQIDTQKVAKLHRETGGIMRNLSWNELFHSSFVEHLENSLLKHLTVPWTFISARVVWLVLWVWCYYSAIWWSTLRTWSHQLPSLNCLYEINTFKTDYVNVCRLQHNGTTF